MIGRYAASNLQSSMLTGSDTVPVDLEEDPSPSTFDRASLSRLSSVLDKAIIKVCERGSASFLCSSEDFTLLCNVCVSRLRVL